MFQVPQRALQFSDPSDQNSEELPFSLDEDLNLGGKQNTSETLPSRDEVESVEDLADEFVKKLLIITQAPSQSRTTDTSVNKETKHSLLSAEISQAISDGLYFYEQVSHFLQYFLPTPSL